MQNKCFRVITLLLALLLGSSILAAGSIYGTVYDSDSLTVAHADIFVYVDGSNVRPLMTSSGHDGSYLVERVPNGTCTLTAGMSVDTPHGADYVTYTINVNGSTQHDIYLDIENEIETHQVLGTVSDENGNSIEDANIVLQSVLGHFYETATNASGEWNITEVPVGIYRIDAFKRVDEEMLYRPYSDFIDVNDAAQIFDITLLPLGQQGDLFTFSGNVVDEDNNAFPYAHITIQGNQPFFLAQANSNQDGTFSFADVPAGVYQVRAATTTDNGDMRFFDGTVDIQADVNDYLITMREPQINDTFLAGMVIAAGPDSLGLNHIHVFLTQDDVESLETFTNRQGMFRFDNLTPGTYTLMADPMLDTTEAWTQEIVITEGPNHVIITLENNVNPPETYSLSGTVTNSVTQEPARGVMVIIDDGEMLELYARTNQEGRYSIPTLPAGTYQITIASMFEIFESYTATVELIEDTVHDIVLTPVTSTPGHVFSGQVVDTDNNPLPGIQVTITGREIYYFNEAVSNEDGNFSMTDIPAGTYNLVALSRNPTGTNYIFRDSLYIASDITDYQVTMEANTNPSTFLAGAVITANADSTVIPHVYVALSQNGELVAETYTNQRGQYRFSRLESGTYDILADTMLDWHDPWNGTVEIVEGENFLFIALTEHNANDEYTVSGIVTNSDTEATVAGAMVSIHAPHGYYAMSMTDDAGAYSMSVFAGEYELVVQARPEFEIYRQTIEVSADMTVDVSLEARTPPANYTISGITRIAGTDNPLPIVNIELEGLIFENYLLTRTTPMGGFSFENVPANLYMIKVNVPGYLEFRETIEIDANIENYVIELTPREVNIFELSGVVTNSENDLPVAHKLVILSPLNNLSIELTAMTNRQGRYLFYGIHENAYIISVRDPEYQIFTDQVTVDADTEFNIALIPFSSGDFSLSGVVSVANTPTAGIHVNLHSMNNHDTYWENAVTDADGIYTFDSILAGRYILAITNDAADEFVYTQEINITENMVHNIYIDRPAPAFLRGVVTDGVNRIPLAGATVLLNRMQGPNETSYTTETGSQGGYIFNELVNHGLYRVRVTQDGYAPFNGAIRIEAETVLHPILIPLAVSPDTGNITGLVVNEDEMAIEDALIEFLPLERNFPQYYHATTNENGIYAAELPVGEYIVACFANDRGANPLQHLWNYNFKFYNDTRHIRDAEILTIVADETLSEIDFSLAAPEADAIELPTSLTGYTDTAARELVTDVNVTIYDASNNLVSEATTDADGIYTITGLASGNDYSLVATKDGYAEQTVQFTHWGMTSVIPLELTVLTDTNDVTTTPSLYALNNYPNPFNPHTTISFNIPAASQVKIEIYNVRGQKVNTLADRHYSEGTHSASWDGQDKEGKQVGSGVYFYKLTTSNVSLINKMMLLK